jgi:hypothetical protein
MTVFLHAVVDHSAFFATANWAHDVSTRNDSVQGYGTWNMVISRGKREMEV